jgi:hypothetical protein
LHHRYYFIKNEGSPDGQHFNFEPHEWGIWATAMVNKIALVDYPPRTIEFDAILENYRLRTIKGKKNGAKSRIRHAISSSDFDFDNKHRPVIVNITHPALPPPARRYSNLTSPLKATGRQNPIVELLRRTGYAPKDYNDKVLKDYLAWYVENLPDDYDNAYSLLSVHEIGVDMLDSVPDAATLSSQTKVPFGTAARILKHFHEWLTIIEANMDQFKVLYSLIKC